MEIALSVSLLLAFGSALEPREHSVLVLCEERIQLVTIWKHCNLLLVTLREVSVIPILVHHLDIPGPLQVLEINILAHHFFTSQLGTLTLSEGSLGSNKQIQIL